MGKSRKFLLVETGILSFEIRNSAHGIRIQVPLKRTRNFLHEANPWLTCSVIKTYQVTSLLMSSSPISISNRLFRCRYSNFRDVVASSPSFCRPNAKGPRRARSQAKEVFDELIPLLLCRPYLIPLTPTSLACHVIYLHLWCALQLCVSGNLCHYLKCWPG